MRQKLKATDDYEEMSEGFDLIMLLKTIKDIAYSFQGQNKDLAQALHEAKRRFYLIVQGQSATTQQYLEQFTNMVDVVEHSGGQVGIEPAFESALAEESGKNVRMSRISLHKKEWRPRVVILVQHLFSEQTKHDLPSLLRSLKMITCKARADCQRH